MDGFNRTGWTPSSGLGGRLRRNTHLGRPYIEGYKPQRNYQALLFDVVEARLEQDVRLAGLLEVVVARDADVPTVDDFLARMVEPPREDRRRRSGYARDRERPRGEGVDYLLKEASNASLGRAGELFVLNFERARLLSQGRDRLAADVEHVSVTMGDHVGFDVLSFESDGAERLIEVKTTAFGDMTPFFVSRNQVEVSSRKAERFHLYRLFRFRKDPRLFSLKGRLRDTCALDASEFMARPAQDA